jgi:hypothetical protein
MLHRTGHHRESPNDHSARLLWFNVMCYVLRGVQRKTITDPLVLNPLASVLKADPASLTQMYEAACAAEPGNEKLARQLCFAYLRVQDYGKLKTVRAL